MTRKHFIAIAETLKEQGASLVLCTDMAYTLGRFNNHFDRDRFSTACGH